MFVTIMVKQKRNVSIKAYADLFAKKASEY